MNMQAGYQCSICQQWVYPNTVHYCGGLPGTVGAQPWNNAWCRAPFAPLTPEMIRLIVREEIERVGLRPPEGKSDASS